MSCHNGQVSLRKLSTTNAFVVTDLEDTPSFGIVRCAKKILQGGAKDLARSMTYTFASFEMKHGGASGGINALPDEKVEAIEKFVEELSGDVSLGHLGLNAGKGISSHAFGKLSEVDSRSALRFEMYGEDTLETYLAALGPVVSADQLINLDGKTVLIATHDINNLEEKFDEVLCLNRHCCAFGDPSEVLTEEVIEEMYGSHNEMFKNHFKNNHRVTNDN